MRFDDKKQKQKQKQKLKLKQKTNQNIPQKHTLRIHQNKSYKAVVN